MKIKKIVNDRLLTFSEKDKDYIEKFANYYLGENAIANSDEQAKLMLPKKTKESAPEKFSLGEVFKDKRGNLVGQIATDYNEDKERISKDIIYCVNQLANGNFGIATASDLKGQEFGLSNEDKYKTSANYKEGYDKAETTALGVYPMRDYDPTKKGYDNSASICVFFAYFDPKYITKVVKKEMSQEEIQALESAGYTEEEITNIEKSRNANRLSDYKYHDRLFISYLRDFNQIYETFVSKGKNYLSFAKAELAKYGLISKMNVLNDQSKNIKANNIDGFEVESNGTKEENTNDIPDLNSFFNVAVKENIKDTNSAEMIINAFKEDKISKIILTYIFSKRKSFLEKIAYPNNEETISKLSINNSSIRSSLNSISIKGLNKKEIENELYGLVEQIKIALKDTILRKYLDSSFIDGKIKTVLLAAKGFTDKDFKVNEDTNIKRSALDPNERKEIIKKGVDETIAKIKETYVDNANTKYIFCVQTASSRDGSIIGKYVSVNTQNGINRLNEFITNHSASSSTQANSAFTVLAIKNNSKDINTRVINFSIIKISRYALILNEEEKTISSRAIPDLSTKNNIDGYFQGTFEQLCDIIIKSIGE